MKNIKRLFSIFLGVLWEWIIIPLFFYFVFRNKKIFNNLFPSNYFFQLLVFFLYFVSGIILTILSFYFLHRKGEGTITPVMPTRKLVKDGVYFYCRNPMYLGYSFLYFAFAFLLKNVWFSFISLGIFLFIHVLAKIFEEKKLYERFAKQYSEYRKCTPFILPVKVLNYYENNFFYFLFAFSFILCLFLLLFNFYILMYIIFHF